MFELSKTVATLSSVNPRTELHGDDHVPAADLFFEIDSSNDLLSMFHPSLRSCLFSKDDVAGESDMFPDPNALTVYRFPKLEKFKWDQEYKHCALTVHYGVSGVSDIHLTDVQIDRFVITPKQGGTVAIRFRAKAKPDEASLGRLCSWIQSKTEITLVQPQPEPELDPKSVKQTPAQAAEAMFA